jgi:MFS family permease
MNQNSGYLHDAFVGLARSLRWSYLPPLMVYLAAGISGLTAIVGTFFVKDYLGLSAAFLAGLGFWAGLPWALKMPLGHLVDLFWRHKNYFVYLGALVITASLLIMFGLIAHTESMRAVMSVEAWYVLSVILAPVGYVLQDVVADAMTVEAVPTEDPEGEPLPASEIKEMHTTMQALGRFAVIGGSLLVALLNVALFSDVETLSDDAKRSVYSSVYLYALAIPCVSIAGVILAKHLRHARSIDESALARIPPNWAVLTGSLVFVVFSVSVGSFDIPFAQEIVFLGSMAIIVYLMGQLLGYLSSEKRLMIVGTAVAIFVFRAMPSPGPGLTWFEIDVLLFDEQFLSVLAAISSALTLLGIILLRPLVAHYSIARIIVLLSLVGGFLFLPSIGMYYGLHQWAASLTAGFIDARFIAILNTALESPLGQISMIPLLAWIAKNAPDELKATFFAVFASFTNLALSASSLATKYINQVFEVSRQIVDPVTRQVTTQADYSELGLLLIAVAIITIIVPIAVVAVVQRSPLRSTD